MRAEQEAKDKLSGMLHSDMKLDDDIHDHLASEIHERVWW
jgi:hypothetical protein